MSKKYFAAMSLCLFVVCLVGCADTKFHTLRYGQQVKVHNYTHNGDFYEGATGIVQSPAGDEGYYVEFSGGELLPIREKFLVPVEENK